MRIRTFMQALDKRDRDRKCVSPTRNAWGLETMKLALSFDSRLLLGGYNHSKSQNVQADQSNKLKYFPNISYKLRSCSKSTYSFLTN